MPRKRKDIAAYPKEYFDFWRRVINGQEVTFTGDKKELTRLRQDLYFFRQALQAENHPMGGKSQAYSLHIEEREDGTARFYTQGSRSLSALTEAINKLPPLDIPDDPLETVQEVTTPETESPPESKPPVSSPPNAMEAVIDSLYEKGDFAEEGDFDEEV